MNYYKNYSNDKIVCNLCSHYCKIENGKVGFCGVNQNDNGKLNTLVYGHPVALNIDPIEKKPLYHVLPKSKALSFGTVGCNFKCPFCQNWDISQEKNIDKTIYVSPEQMVNLALEHDCKSIAYTYNEPTIFYPYARDIGIIAKNRGIKNLFITNGFETADVLKDMTNWLDAANVDLKSWSDEYYRKFLKGGLEAVKETIVTMKKEGIWVEVTTLLIEGENDSDKDIEAMALFLAKSVGVDTPWHLSAFHPDYKMNTHKRTDLQTLQRAKKIAQNAGLNYVYLGNVAIDSDTICPNCGELLIRRTAFETVSNQLIGGHCPRCKRAIEGIWK